MRRWGSPAVAALVSVLGASPTLAEPSMIDRVRVQGDGETARVIVEGNFAVPTYSVRAQDGGRRVVVDVPQASLPAGGIESAGRTPLVARYVASTTALGARIVISLREAVTYHARASSGRIEVQLEPMSTEARVDDEEDSEDGPASVRDAHIERRDGRDRVVLELTRAAPFRIVPGEKGHVRLEIPGAKLSRTAPRKLQGLQGSSIGDVRIERRGDRTVVTAEHVDGARATAIREGRRIVWLFAPPPQQPRRSETRTVATERDYRELSEPVHTPEVAGFVSGTPMQLRAGQRRGYQGRRIDLDFKDADIHNILRLISEVAGVNVVTSDEVSGTVTIRMRNVPWDEALDVILQAKGLGMVRRGNLIRVAPLETLEKEREAAIARMKQQEQLAPIETRLIPASYASAKGLQARVHEMLSDRGSVSVDERTNVLIVRDIVENLDNVEALVQTLDTQTPQVLVEARIVEATSQYTRDVGIQWGGDVTVSSATGNPTGLVFPSDINVAGGNFDAQTPSQGLSPFNASVTPSNFAVNLPAITGTGQGGALGISLGSLGGNVNLAVRLSAAEASGVVRIISSPRILTLDNHEAHIAQGTLIPYSQVSAQGVQTAFQEAKLELEVQPHVTSDGSVSMHVKVTRDEPDFTRTSSRGDPTILKREAETDLLVSDGETAVIGGIYTRNSGRNVDQVPFFGDLPIIGALFKRRRVRDERNELLIFLTPRIVNRERALQEG